MSSTALSYEDTSECLLSDQRFCCGCQTATKEMPFEPMPLEFRGTHYAIGGQVKSPERYEYRERATVLSAVAEADGFTGFASAKKVIVWRSDGQRVTVNCIKAQNDASRDIGISPGDTIHVPGQGLFRCDY